MRSLTAALLLGGLLVSGLLGCGPTGSGGDDDVTRDGGQRDGPITGCGTEGSKQCELGTNAWQTCQGGHWITAVTCPLACDATLGCVECVPGSTTCDGLAVMACTAAGKKGTVPIATCKTACSSGTCSDPCGQAEASKSYLGCDYYPTVTLNANLPEGFSFAVAVANSTQTAANVTITGGTLAQPITQAIPPSQLATIILPWVPSLNGTAGVSSVLLPGGAYHLVSDQPVSVYQFNALEYGISQVTFSWTNDASLLLPSHVLGDANQKSTYIVVTRPSHVVRLKMADLWSPGFFAAVGTQDGTRVDVTFTAHTLAGTGVPQQYAPGSTATFGLDRGTVLMIASDHPADCPQWSAPDSGNDSCAAAGPCYYCNTPRQYDLTGTEITADKPIGVFGGHNCSFVPYNKWACDHLEEQLFPLHAWGKHYVGTRAVSLPDPNLWRVVAGEAASLIRFSPPINDQLTNTVITQVTLDKGQWIEFITGQDFEAASDSVFAMAGFMVGQNYSTDAVTGAPGDPAMSMAVPVEQFRRSYTFLAPESYTQNYVNIVAKPGSTVRLDGNAITDFTPIGASDWGVNKLTIPGGTHTISTDGTDGFGIQVYGVGSYTSYMYPGGLDVKEIYVPD
jgi:hypothetical protein